MLPFTSMPRAIQISVLMIAWNAEQTISESIQSILKQTYKNFEFIIVDDSSSDGTWKLIQAFKRNNKRIITYRNVSNLGIAGSRNRAISLASGKYIAWQDADDISYPTRLELQYSMLEKSPNIGIIGASLEFFDAEGTHSIRTYKTFDQEIRAHIFRYSPVAQPVAMIRKASLDRAGLYDLRYPPAEDLDMSFRIGTHFKFANLSQPLLKYRIASSSATYKKLRKIEMSTLKIRLTNIFNPAYRFTLLDLLFNLVQYLLIIWLPPKVKIELFNIFRNKPYERNPTS